MTTGNSGDEVVDLLSCPSQQRFLRRAVEIRDRSGRVLRAGILVGLAPRIKVAVRLDGTSTGHPGDLAYIFADDTDLKWEAAHTITFVS